MEQWYYNLDFFRIRGPPHFRVRDSSKQIPAVRLVDDYFISVTNAADAMTQNLVPLEQFFGNISEKLNESLETENLETEKRAHFCKSFANIKRTLNIRIVYPFIEC